MGVSKSDAILIVGGGAFGLSTAYHLAQKGYTNVSVFERDDHIPPRYSAANDLNKIVRAEYEDPFYTDLTIVCKPMAFTHLFKSGQSILIIFWTIESNRRVEDSLVRPSFPPDRLPPLRVWRGASESDRHTEQVSSLGRAQYPNQAACLLSRRRGRYPSNLLAVRWPPSGLERILQ
jgi:glycine/D-amino acid oxidase-like deaminating enzyme